jgi:hypothetical protein
VDGNFNNNLKLNKMKRQTRKVGVAGGFFNQLMGNNSTTPKVGEGATILMYSDRGAYEVIEVSADGDSCVIRAMNCKFVGSAYGDEQYEYESNPNGCTMTIVWNSRKGCWCQQTKSVKIIKSLSDRLFKEHGYNWGDHLPNGITYKELMEGNSDGVHTKLKIVDGVTKEYTELSKVSIIFGVMEQYRDPSF